MATQSQATAISAQHRLFSVGLFSSSMAVSSSSVAAGAAMFLSLIIQYTVFTEDDKDYYVDRMVVGAGSQVKERGMKKSFSFW
jgi:hypothetical protein